MAAEHSPEPPRRGPGNMRETLAGRAEELCIWAFPDDNRIRRIAWFGHVQFVDRAMKRNQPSVLVYLSEVLEPLVRRNPDRPIYPNFVVSRPITTWVSVGTVALLRIGDLWRGQHLFHSPALEFETFKALEVNPGTVKEVQAGIQLEDGHYMLPLSEHPWHRECTQSFCSRVALHDGRLLVIPAIELIRFYFGKSSKLLSALFRTDLTRDLLYKRVHVNPETGHMFLDLAVGMPGASAEDIARIAGSRYAWAAALHVGLTCLQGSVPRKIPYPGARFPFIGLTDLQVHGQWLPRGKKARQIFIVNRIASCSHPFPFQKLTYNLDGPAHGANGGSRDGRGANSARSGTPKHPRLEEKDATDKLAPHTYTFRKEPRFPDLERKYVSAQRPIVATVPAKAGPPSEPIEEVALGTTGTSDRRREVILVEHLEREKTPDFLRPVIEALLLLQGVHVQLLTGDAEHGYVQPVALLFDEDGVIEDGLLVEENGNSRLRQLAAFMVSKEERQLIFVVVESEPLFQSTYPCARGDAKESHSLMERAARDFLQLHREAISSDSAISAKQFCAGAALQGVMDWAEIH